MICARHQCPREATVGRLCGPCAEWLANAGVANAKDHAKRPTIHRSKAPVVRSFSGIPVTERPEPVKRGPTPEAIVTDESKDALKEAGLLVYGTQPSIVGVRLYRNNNGRADVIAYPGAKPYPLKYGLGDGTADFVGRIVPFGIWISLEMKAPGKEPTPDQWDDIHLVRAEGGYADWSDSAARTVEIVRAAIAWAQGKARSGAEALAIVEASNKHAFQGVE